MALAVKPFGCVREGGIEMVSFWSVLIVHLALFANYLETLANNVFGGIIAYYICKKLDNGDIHKLNGR